ncbi:MAG: hypothetical protein WKF84_03965 [Pyrinomonadaceae bacterium]
MLEIIEDLKSPLDHQLAAHLPALSEFSSTKEMLASPLYNELRPEIERVLGGLVQEDFAHQAIVDRQHQWAKSIHATAWNIERGTHLQSIISVLREHLFDERKRFIVADRIGLRHGAQRPSLCGA